MRTFVLLHPYLYFEFHKQMFESVFVAIISFSKYPFSTTTRTYGHAWYVQTNEVEREILYWISLISKCSFLLYFIPIIHTSAFKYIFGHQHSMRIFYACTATPKVIIIMIKNRNWKNRSYLYQEYWIIAWNRMWNCFYDPACSLET